jgi:hypothetical protein
MKLKTFFIFQFSFFILLAACNQRMDNEDSGTTALTTESEEMSYVKSNTVSTPQEPSKMSFAEEKTEPAARQQVKTPATKAKAAAAPAKPKTKTTLETIYVETYGAQGKVWGHVTMNGDRGTGTIHDFDENTLSVTVTRHGDELFAVDQNSRQYVFKLKQNKTQE